MSCDAHTQGNIIRAFSMHYVPMMVCASWSIIKVYKLCQIDTNLGCILVVTTNNCFGLWPVVNQWPIKPEQSMITIAKMHPFVMPSSAFKMFPNSTHSSKRPPSSVNFIHHLPPRELFSGKTLQSLSLTITGSNICRRKRNILAFPRQLLVIARTEVPNVTLSLTNIEL